MQRAAKHFACAAGVSNPTEQMGCFATRCMTLYLSLNQVPEYEAMADFEHFTQYKFLLYNTLPTIKHENDSVNKRLTEGDNG
jgi:hypothetical protein